MRLEIQPEPNDEERKAIVVALERLLPAAQEPPAHRSEWRRAGLRENVEELYATARPRSRPGASRA